MSDTQQITLPPLREELRLLPATANSDGSPAWMVQDPVNNRFFRIGWLDFELLLRWREAGPEQIIESINAETTLMAGLEDVKGLQQFLEQHNLLRASNEQAVIRLAQRATSLKKGFYEQLIHHYLFIRIPLVRPQFWLQKILPFLLWIFTRNAAGAFLAIAVTGIYLAARQWDVFVNTFVDQLTWSGLLGYSIALVCAKTIHEMGHALTATRYGVRVAHMGVALVVMFPMLYTDTSESWKLSNSRQRLAIASAGLIAELALAAVATLAWSLAPQGSLKSALFFLATTSWVLTLAVNASPLMRFDGYFILSDVLDIPNLHERAGALARTWLRKHLLGWTDEWPERLPGHSNGFMVAFALLTWLYRLVVFLGIALLVYHFFFKLLGLMLFAVELVVFIGRPIATEVMVWWKRRGDIKAGRRRMAWLLLGLFFLGALVPWHTSVQGPGEVHAALSQVIYSPLPGRLQTLPAAGTVTSGQTLFVLESPDLGIAAERANSLAQARAKELVGLSGLPEGESRRVSVQLQQDQFAAEASLYGREQLRMRLTAPFTGVLRDLEMQLTPGVWVSQHQQLAVLVDPAHWVVDAYIAESDIARVRPGDKAKVRIRSALPYFRSGVVTEVEATRVTALPHIMLDAQSGGPLATLPGSGNAHVTRDSIYRVKIALDEPPVAFQVALAEVVIAGQARAWLYSVVEGMASVLIRESGF